MTTPWRAETLAGIARQHDARLPLLPHASIAPVTPGLDLWDMWPLACRDGTTAVTRGRSLWFFLAAPRFDDPEQRHDHARIHLLTHGSDGWRAHGPALPDNLSPGTREWSGSAVLEDDGAVTLFFTATGRRGEPHGYEQRLFETRARLTWNGDMPTLSGWTAPRESFAADGRWYRPAVQATPDQGFLKGFRDPAFFQDPADGAEYLTFTGSATGVATPFDGVIGLARRVGEGWMPLPPLVSALGVASEMERPHIVLAGGGYYLFWSTPAHRFAPGVGGVTGLYAMVAPAMSGPWTPVNTTSLVAANPTSSPAQAYCWWVTGELDVLSFIDLPGAITADPAERRARFGGVPAPFFRLAVAGERVAVAAAAQAARLGS